MNYDEMYIILKNIGGNRWKKSPNSEKQELFLEEILNELPDPIHNKLIQAYKGHNPVESMEYELKKILLKVLQNEN